MWMSKCLSERQKSSTPEKGKVTLSSGQLEAGSTLMSRGIESYAPYGYQSNPPVGESVMIIPSNSGQALVGTLCKAESLETGEVRLSSLGGAVILLKNDGSIVLNGLVINKYGVIENE